MASLRKMMNTVFALLVFVFTATVIVKLDKKLFHSAENAQGRTERNLFEADRGDPFKVRYYGEGNGRQLEEMQRSSDQNDKNTADKRTKINSVLEQGNKKEEADKEIRENSNDHDTESEKGANFRYKRMGAPEQYQLAHKESFSFFDDIPNKSWESIKQRAKTMPNHLTPENPLLDAEKPEKWYQSNWEPSIPCLHELRIGGMGADGKWVCNPHRIGEIYGRPSRAADCLVYSVGQTRNLHFEEALQEVIGEDNCEIHIFDPNDYQGALPPHMYFHAWGIEAHDDDTKLPNFKSFQDTVVELGHENRLIDILKIDCEGCEWRTFQDWLDSKVDIRQILVETHFVPSNANIFFETLQKWGYAIFHKEANSWSGGGSRQEYSFVRLDPRIFQ